MMENYRGGHATCAKEDRISNLHEHLIDSILERLPVQDAVRTSIISKWWRYRWTTMRTLVFDEQFFKKYAKNGAFGRNGFIRIVTKLLILHKGPILKFLLHIPKINMFLDSFEEVDQWMLLLSRNGVRELILVNSSQCSELPSNMFSCLQLKKLKLEHFFFKPPLEFEGFTNLKELHLEDIDFKASLCGTQIILPQLKKLLMNFCTNVYKFNIKATKLQTLNVSGYLDAMLLRLLHSPCLTYVGMLFLHPTEDFVRVERMALAMMLSKLPEIESLSFNGLFFKVLTAEKIPKWLPHAVDSLESLRLINFELCDLDQLHGVLCLLRNSPNLESLSVMSFDLTKVLRVSHYDEGPASDHLDAPNCLDCTLNQLQTVEIECLKGSRPELLFIKLLLAHSPYLEKFNITPSEILGVRKVLDISKDIMRFPRASPNAEVIYNIAN